MSEVGKALSVNLSTLTRIVDRLVERDLVVRIILTPQGNGPVRCWNNLHILSQWLPGQFAHQTLNNYFNFCRLTYSFPSL